MRELDPWGDSMRKMMIAVAAALSVGISALQSKRPRRQNTRR